MTLDAALPPAPPEPLAPSRPIDGLIEQCAAALRQVAASIAKSREPPFPDLRARQRECARRLGAAGELSALELVALTDRLVDNIDTLRHLVVKAQGAREER